MRFSNSHYYYCQWILLFTFLARTVHGESSSEEECGLRWTKGYSHDNECRTGVESYRPWPMRKTCDVYDVKVHPEGTFKPTALVSFPASGHQLLLRLVERTSGILTGSVESISPIYRMRPDYNVRCGVTAWDGKTIIQWTSEALYKMTPKWYTKMMSHYREDISWPTISRVHFNYRGVILVRNPWHSLFNTREIIQKSLRICTPCERSPKRHLERNDFDVEHFKKYFEFGAKLWVDQVRTWVKNSPHGSELIIVQYEQLIANPDIEVRRVLKYLNITVDEERLKCALGDPERFHEHFPDHQPKARILYFFEKSMDCEGSQILTDGMIEINEMLRLKGVREHLEYSRPSASYIVGMKDEYTTKM